MRWKIEMFRKILKSGCQAEHAKLRTTERLNNLLAIQCKVAWRVFWLCMANRTMPQGSLSLVFTDNENLVKMLSSAFGKYFSCRYDIAIVHNNARHHP
jgi:hypothetical protein